MIGIEAKEPSMDESAGMFIYSHEKVDQDLSLLTTFDDEVTGLQHYLPECDINCFDHRVGFETFSSLEGIDIESFSCAFEYDQIKFDGDALDLYLAQEGEETKAEGDSIGLHGTDKNVLGDFNLQFACKEIILDAEAADKVSHWSYGAWGKSCLGNMAVESHSPHIHERGCHAETSEFSSSRNCSEIVNGLDLLQCGKTSEVDARKTVCLSSPSSYGSSLDSSDVLDDQFVSADKHKGREKPVDLNSLKTVSSPLKKVIFGSASESSTSGVLVTQKIMERSATDKLQGQNSSYHHRKGGASSKDARDRSLVVKSLKQNYKGLGAVQFGFQEESLQGSCVEAPFSHPVQKGQSSKLTSLVNDFDDHKDSGVSESNEDSDMGTSADTQDDASEGDYGTRRKARKRRRHRRWTTSEVIKLIEGVSEYGVGKWTHIKKSLFSSSSYRTSVNLKDKWRNLLKASGNEMLNKRKVEPRQTQASQQLPESVWCRVRELAVIYSYPRESKTKVSCHT